MPDDAHPDAHPALTAPEVRLLAGDLANRLDLASLDAAHDWIVALATRLADDGVTVEQATRAALTAARHTAASPDDDPLVGWIAVCAGPAHGTACPEQRVAEGWVDPHTLDDPADIDAWRIDRTDELQLVDGWDRHPDGRWRCPYCRGLAVGLAARQILHDDQAP